MKRPTARFEALMGGRHPPISGEVKWVNTLVFESADAAVGQTYTVDVEAFALVTRYLGAPCVSVEDGLATIDLNRAVGVERFRSPAD